MIDGSGPTPLDAPSPGRTETRTETSASAQYYDGQTNRKRNVALRLGTTLEILEGEEVIASWPWADIRRADAPVHVLRLKCLSTRSHARLEIRNQALQREILAHSPSVGHSEHPRQTWRIVGWSVAAACSILAIAIFGIPLAADRLAPLIPSAAERRIGDATDQQVRALFGGRTCTDAAGNAAFVSLIDKIKTAGGIDVALETEVLSASLPNAFALPGGRIYLFKGLLEKAQNPDEIAGIMAHELGHFANHDNMRQLIQTGGTSFLVGLLFGDVVGAGAVIFATRELLNSSHSREAETNADAYAIDVMHKLGRSPKPLGDILNRVTRSESKSGDSKPRPKSGNILSSHPLTEERVEMIEKNATAATGPELLSAAEWQALKGVCASTR